MATYSSPHRHPCNPGLGEALAAVESLADATASASVSLDDAIERRGDYGAETEELRAAWQQLYQALELQRQVARTIRRIRGPWSLVDQGKILADEEQYRRDMARETV